MQKLIENNRKQRKTMENNGIKFNIAYHIDGCN